MSVSAWCVCLSHTYDIITQYLSSKCVLLYGSADMLLIAALAVGALLTTATPRSSTQPWTPRAAIRMQSDGDSAETLGQQVKKSVTGTAESLGVGELVKKGVAGSWVNPAYWNRQYVTASHIANNVPNGSAVIELGKDAKNLYYLNSPGACTLIIPPANEDVKEGPIREAAAKLNVPFVLYTDQPLDTIPIRTSACDAALCFDMLDGAPEEACAGAIALLARSLKPGGRLLFLERETVGLPQLMREYDFGDRLEVDFENEGGYDVGVATRRVVGRPSRKAAAKPGAKKKGGARVIPEAALKGGFGATVPPKKASGEAKAAQKQEWAAAKEKAKAERAAARAAEEERVTAERAVAQERAAAEERVVAERAAAEKAAAELAAAKEAAAERVMAEMAVTEKVAAEKVAAETAATEKVAEQMAAAERAAAERRVAEMMEGA